MSVYIEGCPLPAAAKDSIESQIQRMMYFLEEPRHKFPGSIDEDMKALKLDGIDVLHLNDQVMYLKRASLYLQCLHTHEANRELFDYERLAIDRLNQWVESIGDIQGRPLFTQADPRGRSIGIILKSGRSNNMGGEDWRL